MFLMDLKAKIEGLQAERGNVLLSRVHVMHGNATLIEHAEESCTGSPSTISSCWARSRAGAGDEGDEEGPGHTDIMDPDVEGLLALSLEDRLARCSLGGVVLVTGEELVQLLEFKAEAIAAMNNKKPPEGTAPTLRVEHDVEAQGKAAEAAGEPLAKVAEDAAQRAAGE